jgi:hypothetical protein
LDFRELEFMIYDNLIWGFYDKERPFLFYKS